MDSDKQGLPTGIIWAQVVGMLVLGMALAIALGLIFTDEPVTRFISIGLVFGLSSIASIRKRHVASLMVFAGGLLWFLQIAFWTDMVLVSLLGWALVLGGLITWAVGGRHRRSATSDVDSADDDGDAETEQVIGTDVVETSADEIHLSGKATNARRVMTSQAFRGGEVSVSLGNLEIDLTPAQLADGGAALSVASHMGNVTVRVPSDWVVRTDGSFTMGTVKDDRTSHPTDGPLLELTINTTMGAVTIEN